MDRDEVEVHKNAKKEGGQYPAILTSRLANKGFIIWLYLQVRSTKKPKTRNESLNALNHVYTISTLLST